MNINTLYIGVLCLVNAIAAHAQVDTTGWWADRRDSLETAVVSASVSSNYIPRGKDIKAEVITAAGLCKMACCSLAESFENSASVSVGYSDAVTGARQIRLLGQSGIYTQLLDENRPVMRGLSAPFGLSFVPGQWLESIQVSKGVSSVINGVESMTGQINLEHRKPTDEKPLFLHASVMDNGKFDINAVSSLQLDYDGRWNTVILAHVDANRVAMDMNGDGFLDDPRSLQFSLSNRWLYFDPSGLQFRFGVRAIQDNRQGGQDEKFVDAPQLWTTDILNRSLDAYIKVGLPLDETQANSIALVADYNVQGLDSQFGPRLYNALQHNAFINLLYQKELSESHKFTLGFSDMFDYYVEDFAGTPANTPLNTAGIFGEYTFHVGDKFSAITGLRLDHYLGHGLRFIPRLTLKYAPLEDLVFRANAGRGIRYSTPLIDNIGVLSTSKQLLGDLQSHPLEDSWTAGGNVTWYMPWMANSFVSFDYFRTQFTDQMIVDYDSAPGVIEFYNGGESYTNNYQLDISIEPVKRLTLTLTGRITDAKMNFRGRGLQRKPMTSLYKGVFNAQYATHLNRWIFDFTASINGPCAVWDFMKENYENACTPAYPLLYLQVTRRFKGFDVYAGVENLTNYTQPNPIINSTDPFSQSFDASCVWGPLMGRMIYAGVRLTIWKTE